MSYRPDYERTLNGVVETVMPKTPEDWGLVVLTLSCIAVVILVLEAVRTSCTHHEDGTPPPELR